MHYGSPKALYCSCYIVSFYNDEKKNCDHSHDTTPLSLTSAREKDDEEKE